MIIVKNCNVRKCLSSDHYVVYFDVCKEKPPAQKIKSVTRNKTVDMPSFVSDLQVQLSQLEIIDTTMTNYAYDSFEQILPNVLDKHVPATTRVRTVRPLSRWYNDEIIRGLSHPTTPWTKVTEAWHW